MGDHSALRQEIIAKTIQYYRARFDGKEYIPGKTRVNYAGRVFDEKEIVNAVEASLDFWLTEGRFSENFAEKISEFLGVEHVLLTNSGSSANLLAFAALTSEKLGERRLKPGDEVISVAAGFPATVAPIIQYGLVPVFVDVTIPTYNIDTEMLRVAITPKTRCIFLAHTLGNPFDIDSVMQIAEENDLWIIEDNCDAFGSEYKGRKTGTFGHISTISFYPAHHITTGEGGAVCTGDPQLAAIARSFRDWGRDCYCAGGENNTCGKRFSQQFGDLPLGFDHKYVYSHIGYNLKATDMQAAIGVAQMQKLPKFIKLRRRNFDYLYRHLRSYEQFFILPRAENFSEPSWFGFPLLVREEAPFDRAEIVDYLERHKIATRMLFGGNLLKQPAYAHMKCRVCGALKNTDLVMSNLFWIGVYPGLTKQELKYTLEIFDRFLAKFKS